jgi:hypothetical protein
LLELSLNPRFLLALLSYIRTTAVGANLSKIKTRLIDLKFLINLLKSHTRILEFGSGFSTLFFGYHRKIQIVFSVEEFCQFVPKYVNKKNYVIVQETINFESSRKFHNIENSFGTLDMIYIDGPQILGPEKFKAPNLDLFDFKLEYLKDTVIAIDVRYTTVARVYDFLKTTHKMF